MTENPAVVDGFVDVYNQWVDLGVDGFRIDTAKHVNFEFWQKFTTGVRDHAASVGNDDFFMFGEVYDADPVKLAPYLRDSDMNAVLDFTFQSAASNYAKGFSAGGLAALYAGDDRYTTPTTNAQALPTFLGNHDMGRIGYFVKDADQPGAALGAGALAHVPDARAARRLLRRRAGLRRQRRHGQDKDARQSLFATQVAEYANQNLLDGTLAGSVDRYDTDSALYEHIAELAALRSSPPGAAARRADRAATPTARSTRSRRVDADGEGRAPRRDEQRHGRRRRSPSTP